MGSSVKIFSHFLCRSKFGTLANGIQLFQQLNISVLGVFLNQAFFLEWCKKNQTVSKLTFFQTSMNFHSALGTFQPQNHVVVEHCGAENIPLVSGRLVSFFIILKKTKTKHSIHEKDKAYFQQFFLRKFFVSIDFWL